MSRVGRRTAYTEGHRNDDVQQLGFSSRVKILVTTILMTVFLLPLVAPVYCFISDNNNSNNARSTAMKIHRIRHSVGAVIQKEDSSSSSSCAALTNLTSKGFNASNVMDLSGYYPNLTITDIRRIVGIPGGYGTKNGVLNGNNDSEIPLNCNLYQPNDHRIIYFVHIHKSGGTTLCAAARANNALSDYEYNCNVKHSIMDAEKRLSDPRCCGGDSLHQHYEYARRTHYGFVSNEWPMLDTIDVSDYHYVVVLRHSWSRYKSHQIYYGANNLTSFLDFQPDNYNVRMICGQVCLKRPKFHLTLQDLDYTVARLKLFDSIILLEDFNKTYTQFASRVGWKLWPGRKNAMPSGKQKRPQLSNEEYEMRVSMTALDNALYEVAQALVENSEDRVLDGDFSYSQETQLGLKEYLVLQDKYSQCTRPCCHRKCQFEYVWGDKLNALLNYM